MSAVAAVADPAEMQQRMLHQVQLQLARLERAGPMEVAASQAQSLERMLRHAHAHVPFYRDRLAMLFDGEHFFLLDRDGDGGTRMTHGEKFSGILVSLMGGATKNADDGFDAFNRALMDRAERVTSS